MYHRFLALATGVVLLIPSEALGLTALSGSAAAWGAAGAMIARPRCPEALSTNPAAVAGAQYWEIVVGAASLRQGGTYASERGWTMRGPSLTSPLPAVSGVVPVGEGWTIGVAISNPYRRWVAWPDELADSLAITAGEFRASALTAAVAWESSPRLTFGLGLEFQYGAALVRSGYWPLPEDPAQRGRARFKADGMGTGLTFGLLWELSRKTVVGVTVTETSPIGAEGTGDFEVPPEQRDSYPGGRTRASFEVPSSFRVGVSHQPHPSVMMELDLEWQGSSRLHQVEFELGEGDTSWTWDLGWRDALVARLGGSWSANSWLTLRAGYAWERTIMGKAGPSSLLPGTEEKTVTVGAGFTRGRTRFDAALARAWRDGSAQGYPDFPPGTLSSRSLALAFSLAYRFEAF